MSDRKSTSTAYVGLGSNLGERQQTIDLAVAALGDRHTIIAVSPLYESSPVAAEGGPFLNGVVSLETTASPRQLLEDLLRIEESLGRRRGAATARDETGDAERDPVLSEARSIDLDLLLFGDAVISEETLTVPHPRMAQRVFVLRPLADLDPELILPCEGGGSRPSVSMLLRQLLERYPGQRVRRWLSAR